jgi:hypothetical protein
VVVIGKAVQGYSMLLEGTEDVHAVGEAASLPDIDLINTCIRAEFCQQCGELGAIVPLPFC